MCCSDPCCWIHQGTGLRPLDALMVGVLKGLTSILKLTDHFHRSAHFIDPFLRAVLESSFTPDDNDLFLTNLVDTPALVIHGCVPNWILLTTFFSPHAVVKMGMYPPGTRGH
jgi:hypothetical protein